MIIQAFWAWAGKTKATAMPVATANMFGALAEDAEASRPFNHGLALSSCMAHASYLLPVIVALRMHTHKVNASWQYAFARIDRFRHMARLVQ